MSSAKETSSKKAAPWSDFPEYKEFWDGYIDLFWGKGGTTPYSDMLAQDIEWLKEAYLKNNESMTQLESNYIRELEGGQIGLRFGGGPALNILPKSSKHIAEQRLGVGRDQGARILDYAGKFTPNRTQMELMNKLKGLGAEGQNLRMGLPTETKKGSLKQDTDVIGTIGDVAKLGSDVSKIWSAGERTGLWEGIGDNISSWFDSDIDSGIDAGTLSEEAIGGGDYTGGDFSTYDPVYD